MLSIGNDEGRSHPIFSSQYGDLSKSTAVPNLVVPVNCSLCELFNGCKKTLTYQKQILSKDGQSIIEATETKTINIPPGSCASNPICFGDQGNQAPG